MFLRINLRKLTSSRVADYYCNHLFDPGAFPYHFDSGNPDAARGIQQFTPEMVHPPGSQEDTRRADSACGFVAFYKTLSIPL